jgi:hypothetical protein
MIKTLASLGLWLLLSGSALAAQANPTCPTRPPGDNTNACASTAFVIANAGGGGGTPGGSTTQVQFNSAGAFSGSGNLTWVSPALTIGNAGGTTGLLKLTGATSGTITIQGQSAAGTYNFNLPITAGTAGDCLAAVAPRL